MPNLYNEHLVAVDTGAPDARVVVCKPPMGPIAPEAALVYAAHLIHKMNGALAEKGAPISTPRQLFDKIDAYVKGRASTVTKDSTGLIMTTGRQFFRADEALEFAANLVAVADPEANMLEYVGAVVEAARGGHALEGELKDPRAASIKLSSPQKVARLVLDEMASDSTTPPPMVEEDFPTEAETDAPKRKRGA